VCWSALVKAGDISFIHNTAMMTDFKSFMTEQNQLTSLPCHQLRYKAPFAESKEVILCLVSATMPIRSEKTPQTEKCLIFYHSIHNEVTQV
jgi:hypothetical protein